MYLGNELFDIFSHYLRVFWVFSRRDAKSVQLTIKSHPVRKFSRIICVHLVDKNFARVRIGIYTRGIALGIQAFWREIDVTGIIKLPFCMQ